MSNTIRSVTYLPMPLHNLCMAKKKQDARDTYAIESGIRLATTRRARGWTQEELSRRTGWNVDKDKHEQAPGALAPSRISNYEQGLRRIGQDEAVVFERIFDEYPAAYYMGVISDAEARVVAAMRKPIDPNKGGRLLQRRGSRASPPG